MGFDEKKTAARLLQIYTFNVTKRLMPHIVRTLEKAWKEIDDRSKEATRDGIAQQKFKRVRCVYVANAILRDSVASSGFGYRMNQSTRDGLLQTPILKHNENGRNVVAQGIPFHVLMLERAESYLDMTERAANAANDPAFLKLVKRAKRLISLALSADDYDDDNANRLRRSPRIYRESKELLRWAVTAASHDSTRIQDALWNNQSVLVDIPVEAALRLLSDTSAKPGRRTAPGPRWEAPISPETRAMLLQFVDRRVDGHLSGRRATFEDPMTFFWALKHLAVAVETRGKIPEYLSRYWRKVTGRARPGPGDTPERLCNLVEGELRKSFESRAIFPATPDVPEVAEETHRSECLALVNLWSLPETALPDEGARLIADTLKHFLLIEMVKAASHHWKRNRENSQGTLKDAETWLAGGAIAPSSLHVLSMYMWALRSATVVKKPGTKKNTYEVACAYKLTMEDAVRHATEINIADHRLFGDYLLWNKDSQNAERETSALAVKNEIENAVRAYFASGARRPLNILVCAQPGSGKSFFVKNVLRQLKETKDLEIIEANATQLHSPEALYSRLRRVTSQIASIGKGAFFLDEVDTPLGSGYFFSHLIGPMWDGEYPIDGETLSMKKTLWFFAASAASTPRDFEQWLNRMDVAKRQDYLSRLSLKVELPTPTREANLLTFLGNLRRIYEDKVSLVSREVLDFFATHSFEGGARTIEKCVSMVGNDNGMIQFGHIPYSYRKLAKRMRGPLVKGERAEELVSIVDF